MVIWLSLEIFPRWCDWRGIFYGLQWIGKITAGDVGEGFFASNERTFAIHFGTLFAVVCVRLSSDLQLLAQPRAPSVDTLVGFFFSVNGNIFAQNNHQSDNPESDENICKFRHYVSLR